MQRTCDNCINRDWIKGQSSYLIRTSETCNKCCFKIGKSGVEPTHWELRPTTNADRIRVMSDEELAALLLDGCRGSKCSEQPQNEYGSVDCFSCRLDWLKQFVKDGNYDG